MKIAFDTLILDAKGKPFLTAEGSEEMTKLQDVAENALLAAFPDEGNIPTDEKVARFKLFNKIDRGAWDLRPEEIVMLKKVIGLGYNPLIVGRAFEIIEPEEAEGG